MTRRLPTILLALLLGATTTVLVALACARWSRPTTFSMGVIEHLDVDSPEMEWGTGNYFSGLAKVVYQVDAAHVDLSPPHQRAVRALARRIPIHYPEFASEEKSVGDIIIGRGVLWMKAGPFSEFLGSLAHGESYVVTEKRYGWPLLCLSSGDYQKDGFIKNPDVVDWSDAFSEIIARYHLRSSSGADRMLDTPRVILWPGFIVNTLLFSAPWLLGFIAVLGVRDRWRRWRGRRRGRCPVCGYDLRGDLARGCPECGWGRKASITTEARRHGEEAGI